jgi:hypothetical protein
MYVQNLASAVCVEIEMQTKNPNSWNQNIIIVIHPSKDHLPNQNKYSLD